jgi:hypothetical protein
MVHFTTIALALASVLPQLYGLSLNSHTLTDIDAHFFSIGPKELACTPLLSQRENYTSDQPLITAS